MLYLCTYRIAGGIKLNSLFDICLKTTFLYLFCILIYFQCPFSQNILHVAFVNET